MYVLEELHNESPHTIREYSFTAKFIKKQTALRSVQTVDKAPSCEGAFLVS